MEPEDVAERVDAGTQLVAFSGVQTATGHRSDIAAISGLARAVGAIVVRRRLADGRGGGFSWGMLLMFVGGFAALAAVSSLGFIARLRDRSNARRADLARSLSAPTAPRDPAAS